MPPKGSNVAGPAVRPRQIPQGSPYPGINAYNGLDIPNRTTPNPGFPARMLFPAGALHYEPPVPHQHGAKYYAVDRQNGQGPAHFLRQNLYGELDYIFPRNADGTWAAYDGTYPRRWLQGLAAYINPATVHLGLKPCFSRTMDTLNADIPRILNYGAGPNSNPAQQYTSWTTAANSIVRGKCNIFWVELQDNRVWESSGYAQDLRFLVYETENELRKAKEATARARQEGRWGDMVECQDLVDQCEKELFSHRVDFQEYTYNFHLTAHVGPLSHVVCVVFVCGNFYIYDPSFSNINVYGVGAVQFNGSQKMYTLRQFRMMQGVEVMVAQAKLNGPVNNIFMGGGGNIHNTCRLQTEIFMKNLVYQLGTMQHGQTEEDVIAWIWGTTNLFEVPDCWPISTQASLT